MAKAKKARDSFANMITATVTMSALDTLTTQEVAVGLNIFDKVGLIIHRIEYYLNPADYFKLLSGAEYIDIAVTVSSSITTVAPSAITTLDMARLVRDGNTAAGDSAVHVVPVVHDFSTLPGGGLIVPPKPLYLAMDSYGLASAAGAIVKIVFTIKDLQDTEYLELLETRRAYD